MRIRWLTTNLAALGLLTSGCVADVHQPAKADVASPDSAGDAAGTVDGVANDTTDAISPDVLVDGTGSDIPGPDNGPELPLGDTTPTDTPSDQGPDSTPDVPQPDIPLGWDPVCSGMDEFVDPNCLPQDAVFQCSPNAAPASSPARLRRLSRDELTRASGHRTTSEVGSNPFDAPLTLPYSSFDRGVTVDATTLDLYLSVIDRPGQGWTARDAGIRIRHTYDGDPYKCMWNTPDEACKALWLNGFIQDGLLFRPATAEEYTDLKARLDAGLAAEAGLGFTRQQTLSQVVAAAWLMPQALFHEEVGEDTADDDGRHRLTDWELAKSISYTLTDRGPGATASWHFGAGPGGSAWTAPFEGYQADIEAAVINGTIQEPDTIKLLVRNNAGGIDPERNDLNVELKAEVKRPQRGDYWVSTKIRNFFREWLDYGNLPNAFKDTVMATAPWTHDSFDISSIDELEHYTANAAYSNSQGGGNGNEPTFVHQLDDMIARIIIEDADVFTKLMTSRKYLVPSSSPGQACTDDSQCSSNCIQGRCFGSTWKSLRFAPLAYNITDHIDGNEAARWVDMPPTERAGVLTHPAWLAAHGDAFEDGPSIIHRGKWIREKLLCQYIPPLSKVEGIEAMLQPAAPNRSARTRIEEDIEPRPECMFCHVRMNSLGKAFEKYNHAGFMRGWDRDDSATNQGPVDGSTFLDPNPVAGPYGAMPDPALHGNYTSPIELVEALSSSDVAKRCFVRHTFRYFMGRDERLADACTLDQMVMTFEENGSFIDMLGSLMSSDTFIYRTQNESASCE